MAIECYGWQVRTLISYYMGGFANTYYYYAWHIYIALAVPGVVAIQHWLTTVICKCSLSSYDEIPMQFTKHTLLASFAPGGMHLCIT